MPRFKTFFAFSGCAERPQEGASKGDSRTGPGPPAAQPTSPGCIARRDGCVMLLRSTPGAPREPCQAMFGATRSVFET